MDAAHRLTDKTLAQMERHLMGIYNRAKKEVGASWVAHFREADSELSALKKAYAEAKQAGDKAAIKKTGKKLGMAKRDWTLKNRHFQNLTDQLAKDISHINEQAAAYINGKLPDVYALNYNAVADGVSSAVKGYSFELTDAATVKNLATSDKTLLPYKYVNGKKDVRWNTQLLNSEVLQGILQGEPMTTIAGRLGDVLHMNATSAIRNARTSVTSAENKGRMDMLHAAAEKGIVTQKEWIAAIDARTRESHVEINGSLVDMDAKFANGLLYPGDPDGKPEEIYNCRCSMGYKIVDIVRR